MKKIFLYHKISPKGLNYLGITTRDPLKYKGSGKYWKLHLLKHNLKCNDVKTIVLFESFNRDEIREKGLFYSRLFDVVNREDWANLIPETGDGVYGVKLSEEHKRKIGLAGKGRKLSDETRKRISESNKGKMLSNSAKLKLSQAKKGKPGWRQTPQSIQKLIESKTGKSKKGVPVINIETGQVFDSVRRAAIFYGINEITLAKHIREKHPDCKFRYPENYTPPKRASQKGKTVSEEARKTMSLSNGQRKKVINIETSEIYDSIKLAAESIGLKPDTLSAQIQRSVKSCKFKYL